VRIPTSARAVGLAVPQGEMGVCGRGWVWMGVDGCCFRCALLHTAAQQLVMERAGACCVPSQSRLQALPPARLCTRPD
jgi:hypothetical protein